MAFDFQPVDYAGMLGLRNQPDPRVLAQQQQQIDLQRQQQQAQMAQLQQKQQAAQAYTVDVQQYLKNPTPEAGQQLLLRHPDQAEAFKTYFQRRDQQAQDSDFKEMVRLDGLLSVGRAEEAKAALQARIDAGKAAGRSTPDEEMLLAQLNDDPKKAQGMLSVLIPSIGGVENYAKILEQRRLAQGGGDPFTLGAGEVRYDANGKPIASSPYKPQVIGDASTGYFEYTPGAGISGPAPNSGAVFERMIGAESNGQQFTNGKPTTSSKGAVGIAQVMPGTAPEAARLAGVEWSPEKYRNDASYNRQIGEAYFNKLLTDFGGDTRKAVAAYNAGPGRVQRAIEKGGEAWERRLPAETQNYLRTVLSDGGATPGGATVRRLTPGGGSQTVIMTPQEVAAIPGLDPNTVYQRKPDGTITAVGGQSRSQLKPWPVAALEARTSNNAALTNIGGIISLLDPKNTSAAAQDARNAIGPGTGMLGDTFTQLHDPSGIDARARLGQIGGLIIKDTSGAAVSLSEDQRLAKWVPLITDTPKAALGKLRNLERELKQRNQAMDGTYSEDQGFRPFSQGGAAPGGFRIIGVRPKQ